MENKEQGKNWEKPELTTITTVETTETVLFGSVQKSDDYEEYKKSTS